MPLRSNKQTDFIQRFLFPRQLPEILVPIVKSEIMVALVSTPILLVFAWVCESYGAPKTALCGYVAAASRIPILILFKIGFQRTARNMHFLVDCTGAGIAALTLGPQSYFWVYTLTFASSTMFLSAPSEVFFRRFAFCYCFLVFFIVMALTVWGVFPPEIDQTQRSAVFFGMFNVVFACFNLLLLVVMYQREVNRQRQLLEEQSATMLQQAKMSSLGEMAGGLAHEINNPLAVILGHSTHLLRETGNPNPDMKAIAGKAEKIQVTVNRIAKIVSALRTFSRNADEDPFEKSKMTEILEDMMGFCFEKLKNSKIELRVTGDQNVQLECRPTQICQVLVSLINNAQEAIQKLPEKWIEINLQHDQERLAISITDSGKGIPLAVAQKMMQPFFTTKDIGKGTGLGLSVSKGIIENHGGTITLDRNSPHTRFVIELPLKTAAVSALAASA